ncbi:MAG: hypothetical protein KGZ59_07575 [Chitinophagaceae bacterium]|nr:hypothetical protein [Chitinophagaceae bacterium]
MDTKLNVNFYQRLGRVFYAVAASDASIQKEEINKLKQILRDEWLSVDDTVDEFGTDAAYQIEVVFDWLLENEYDTKNTLKEFEEYVKHHQHFFTKEIKYLILKTANSIAHSFFGKNKSEVIFLTRLQAILYN